MEVVVWKEVSEIYVLGTKLVLLNPRMEPHDNL